MALALFASTVLGLYAGLYQDLVKPVFLDESNRVDYYVTCEPVLQSRVTIFPGKPGPDVKSFGDALMDFEVKFAVFNTSPVRAISVTEVRWMMLRLPDGREVFQYVRGPFRQSIVEDAPTVELPLNLAAGQSAFLYTRVVQPIPIAAYLDLYQRVFSKTSEDVIFANVNDILRMHGDYYHGEVRIADGTARRSGKFLFGSIERVIPVPEGREGPK